MSGLVNAVGGTVQTIVQKARDFGRTWVSEAPGSGPLARPDIFYVPPEITAQIFRACIPPKDLVNHSEEEISHTPMFSGVCKWTPFDLAQVCRDWRSIAFRTRELWQSIAIIGPKRCHLHRAIIWIDNVGHYPIDIVLEQKSDSDEEREVIAELMSLFAVRVASWRLIAFTFFGPKPLTPSNLLVRCITTLAQEKNSILHHALFDFHPHPYDGAEEWEISSILEIFSALQKIPSLAALYWSAAFTPGLKFSRNLVHLDLDSPISIEDLIENVVRSPHLQYLYARNVTSTIVPIHNAFMRQDDDMDVDMENIPRVALPALLHLSIAFNQVDPAPFLDRLALPSLTFLELVGVNPEDLYVVRQLLQVSQCQLGAFLVDLSTPAPEADIMDWLQMEELQCVERLDIHADVTNDIVKMLHRPALHGPKAATGETYFPELKDLTLTLRIAGIDDGDLLRTLGSRFWTPFNEPGWQKELKTATVFLSPEDLTPRLKVYERMFRQGVELNQDGWRNYDSRKLEFLQLSELM